VFGPAQARFAHDGDMGGSVRLSGMDRRQTATASGVALFHGVVAWAVLAGNGVVPVPVPAATMSLFEVEAVPEPPPPAAEPKKAKAPEREGKASPANLKARPKPVAAPKPIVKVEAPPAPPIAAEGIENSAGAAPLPGPGTGAGGEGTGLGSGGQGTGTGGGGGTGARWRKGRIKDSDYPRAASSAKIGGTVVAHFDVGVDGRVSNCRVVASSGNADLDRTTCRLIEKRFRYEPARDASGRPMPDVAGWRQSWWLEPR